MNSPEIKAYDISTFCQLYSIGKTRLYQEIKAGRLQVKKIGRRTIIPAAAAEFWIEHLDGASAVMQSGGSHAAS